MIPHTPVAVRDNAPCLPTQVMLLVRTPDVDCKREPTPTLESAARISKYFKDYKRRFEFQFQVSSF